MIKSDNQKLQNFKNLRANVSLKYLMTMVVEI